MTGPTAYALVALVLAGGESRRFGSDKLAADLDGRTLLAHALDGLPPHTRIAVVGPERPIERRDVVFVREDPPGGGPAAGLIAGLRWALDQEPDLILTLPGDAPAAGQAADRLAAALTARPCWPDAQSVVGVDDAGCDQVLQLAVSPAAARQLIDLAGPGSGRGQSVRRLVLALDPPPQRERLTAHLVHDVDTTEQLAVARRHLRNPDCT